MSFPNQTPLKSALEELRNVLVRCQSDNIESLKLVREIENIVQNIEYKTTNTRIAQEVRPTPVSQQMPGVVVPNVSTANLLA